MQNARLGIMFITRAIWDLLEKARGIFQAPRRAFPALAGARRHFSVIECRLRYKAPALTTICWTLKSG